MNWNIIVYSASGVFTALFLIVGVFGVSNGLDQARSRIEKPGTGIKMILLGMTSVLLALATFVLPMAFAHEQILPAYVQSPTLGSLGAFVGAFVAAFSIMVAFIGKKIWSSD